MNTWGTEIKLTVFGESHAECVGCTFETGVSGLELDFDFLRGMLKRRSAKDDGISTSRHEDDEFSIISGVKGGVTTGTPITAIFKNKDVKSKSYNCDVMRPSHADYPAAIKYGAHNDSRGGGQFSGRMTAPLVFAGAIAALLLKPIGINVFSHIYSIGNCFDTAFAHGMESITIENPFFPLINQNKCEAMKMEIENNLPDSTGGVVECIVLHPPVGLGEPFFDTVEGELAKILFSIPGVRAVEFGSGVAMSRSSGLASNDALYYDKNGVVRTFTNNSGGVNGGMCNGMPIVFRTYFRPVPSIPQIQKTINIKTMENTHTEVDGRFDACVLPRAAVVVEAVAALVIYDLCRRM
ncbi:MAG: chorismate synthase [Clostridia bacterium]